MRLAVDCQNLLRIVVMAGQFGQLRMAGQLQKMALVAPAGVVVGAGRPATRQGEAPVIGDRPIRPQGGARQTMGVQPLDGKIVNGIDDHAHGRSLGKGARAVNGAPALNFPPIV